MTIINKVSQKSVMPGITPVADIPDSPTIGTATDIGTSRAYNDGAATVTFTAAATGGTPTSYTTISTPGSFTASGAGSPLTVTGLASGTSYTFTTTATNSSGTSAPVSAASNSITATTVPQAPTIGTATDQGSGRAYNNGSASVTFTPGTTGGKTVSSYTVTSSPGSLTGTGSSSPITVTGQSSAIAYTYTVTATNANGTSSISSASNSVTATTVPQAPTIGTFTDGGTGDSGTLSFTAGATGGASITNYKVSTDNVTFTALSPAQTASPLSLSGLSVGTATYYIKAVNTNGDSAASSGVSGTVITPSSFESIATFTGNNTFKTVTFSSIPSTYKHLQIRFINVNGTGGTNIQFNGDTASNYSNHGLYVWYDSMNPIAVYATGSANTTFMRTSSWIGADAASTGYVGIIDILDYASTSKYKTIRNFCGIDINGSAELDLSSGNWRSTSAVTSITVFGNSGANWNTGTRIALYGIKG